MKMTDTYDVHGNATLTATEYYVNGWMVLYGQQFDLTYSGSNVTQRITKEVFSDFASLSIQEWLPELALIKIFPNPAQDQIQLIIPEATGSVSSLSLMDLTGKLIFHEDFLTPRSGIISQSLPVSIVPGMYILRINGPGAVPVATELVTIKR